MTAADTGSPSDATAASNATNTSDATAASDAANTSDATAAGPRKIRRRHRGSAATVAGMRRAELTTTPESVPAR